MPLKKIILPMLLCVIGLLPALAAKAQQDYVITSAGDSISCKINAPLIGSLKYQSATMDKAEKITIQDIKEYYIEKKKIWQRSVIIKNGTRPVFMTVMEKGKIGLYQQITTMYNSMTKATTSTTVWYIAKGSDDVSELKTNSLFLSTSRQNRKDELAQLFMDNDDVYNKYLAEDKFSFDQIRNLVHLYNTGRPFEKQ